LTARGGGSLFVSVSVPDSFIETARRFEQRRGLRVEYGVTGSASSTVTARVRSIDEVAAVALTS
jgi:hypothetical protein